EKRARAVVEWTALAGGVGLVWALVRLATHAREVALPIHPNRVLAWGEQPVLIARSLVAQLNLEDFSGRKLAAFTMLYLGVGIVALVLAMRHDGRERLRAAAPILIGGAVWFLVLTFPLAYVQPGWN